MCILHILDWFETKPPDNRIAPALFSQPNMNRMESAIR